MPGEGKGVKAKRVGGKISREVPAFGKGKSQKVQEVQYLGQMY